MMLKRLFSLGNRKVRILVGLMLVGLFLIHCTQGEANRRPIEVAAAIDGRQVGETSGDFREKIEQLARTDHIALLELCVENYNGRFTDYTCTLFKQERIDGRLGRRQKVEVKFKESPFSVGMKWLENAGRGDRVLFIEGKYDGMMLVRPSGLIARTLVPTARRQPDGRDARKSTLRPVNTFGFKRGMASLLAVYRKAKQRGELVQSFGGYAEVAGRKTMVLVRRLPDRQEYRRTAAPLTRTYIDLDYLVPIMIDGVEHEGLGDNGEGMLCRYVYENVKFNVGLTSDDFRPKAWDLVEQPR